MTQNITKSLFEIVNTDSHDHVVGKGDVVLEYYAEWCGPCRQMLGTMNRSTEIAQYAAERGIVLKHVDVDTYGELARQDNVRHVPTLVAYSGGKDIGRLIGAASADVVLRYLRGWYPAKVEEAAPAVKA